MFMIYKNRTKKTLYEHGKARRRIAQTSTGSRLYWQDDEEVRQKKKNAFYLRRDSFLFALLLFTVIIYSKI